MLLASWPNDAPRLPSAHLTARAKAKRTSAERDEVLRAGSIRARRVGLLYGLTGLFTVVVGGLILARPHPLQASVEGADQASVVLAATNGPAGTDAIDAALQTSNPPKQGRWTGVTVLRLTSSQARAAHAHFKVVLGGDGPQLVVGPEWLHQVSAPTDPTGQFVLVVVVDDHEREVRSVETVVALVDRLCAKLKIDPSRVQWS